ncbi:MAG: hypothetical protein HY744_04255 [Deltaproteobacteria bacterium]|nr:hypothetical protein [Deltaproteobacteria bacterium]
MMRGLVGLLVLALPTLGFLDCSDGGSECPECEDPPECAPIAADADNDVPGAQACLGACRCRCSQEKDRCESGVEKEDYDQCVEDGKDEAAKRGYACSI